MTRNSLDYFTTGGAPTLY